MCPPAVSLAIQLTALILACKPGNVQLPEADAQGKILLLITNSDYQYTDVMMSYCYDRFLPQGMRWRDLFDMVRHQSPRVWYGIC